MGLTSDRTSVTVKPSISLVKMAFSNQRLCRQLVSIICFVHHRLKTENILAATTVIKFGINTINSVGRSGLITWTRFVDAIFPYYSAFCSQSHVFLLSPDPEVQVLQLLDDPQLLQKSNTCLMSPPLSIYADCTAATISAANVLPF